MSTENTETRDKAAWQNVARSVIATANTGLFIDGDYVNAIDGGKFESINPANGDTVATVAAGTQADVDHAVKVAAKAFKGGAWSRMAPRDRMSVMYRWADLMEENAVELAMMDTLDMGKPISDMYNDDMPAVLETFRYFAECIDKIEGQVTNTEYGVLSTVLHEPIGVVACISPWNYPLLMAAWKIVPSLAAGNSTILKPAEQSPLSCLKMAELFVEAGGPTGVLNVINGMGETAGQALARHMDVGKVSFTGSTEVGKLMMIYSGESNMKKVSLECGGKSPQIFLGDISGDLMQDAIETAYHRVYYNMGEVCSAGSRLIVNAGIYDEFIGRFIAEANSTYVCGDPLDPETNLGPLVDHGSQTRVLAMVEAAQKEGAQLEFGGDIPGGSLAAGAYVNPTLLTGVKENDSIAQNEVFGPVISVIKSHSDEEAIAIANNSDYGLVAGIWTNDFRKAHRFASEIECGTVYVNSYDEGDMTQPFGGYKQSGNARDKCFESLLAYTQTKAAWFRFD